MIKGIIFDKDGTIIQFHALWTKIAGQLIDGILPEVVNGDVANLKVDLLEAIGVCNGKVESNGVLAAGTTVDMLQSFRQVFNQHKLPLHLDLADMEEEIYKVTCENIKDVLPTANLHELLKSLLERGIKLGIATADDYKTTMLCLETLGIADYFEFIGTSDIYNKKPDSQMLDVFSEKTKLSREEIAIIGDTKTDMVFAKEASAGLTIAVESGVGRTLDFLPYADYILPSIGELIVDQELVWNMKANKYKVT